MALEFIHITSAYSNAVLVAILPQVTQFSEELDLPVLQPIKQEHVQFFRPDRRAGPGFVGGHLVLTNGYEFWYQHGHVTGFAAADSYFMEQGIEKVSD